VELQHLLDQVAHQLLLVHQVQLVLMEAQELMALLVLLDQVEPLDLLHHQVLLEQMVAQEQLVQMEAVAPLE
jgi:hypothetical protein